jgi:hypothetical protein
LPDFSWYIVPKHEKYTKLLHNIPNGHKIGISTFSIPSPAKNYPNWDFWFGKIPSGNPGGLWRETFFYAVAYS